VARRRTRRGSPLHITPSFDLFSKSKRLVQDNLGVFLPLYFVPLIFSIHSWIWSPAVGSHQPSFWTDYSWFGNGFNSSVPVYFWYGFVGFSIIWIVFVIAAGTIVQIMAQSAQLEVAEGRKLAGFQPLWATAKELGWRMLGLYLLIGLYVVVGLILLIVPGLIMLRRYFLAPYVMLDKKCSIKEAMDTSAEISKPYSGYVWGVIGVIFLIGLINIIPFIGWIISFIVGMFYSVAPAMRYRELRKLSSV
jgi:uncharacterized membrane protein